MQNQKDKFQLKEGVSYINCAYMSPLLKSSEEAGFEGMKRKRNPFEVTQEDFFKDVVLAKDAFSRIVNCEAESVAIFPSVSYGFASVLNSFQAKNKKHCILVSNEFPSGYFEAEKWAKKNTAELKVVSPTNSNQRIETWNEDILNAINEDTAFVLMSSVHWMDGSIFDLEKIGAKCRLFGAKLLVDGTQTVGALPLDLKKANVDFLVCATYKWLFGPYSSAIGYVSSEFEQGEALEESWMNRSNAVDFSKLADYGNTYFPGAAKFNVGETNDFIKIPMLVNSFEQILDWKVSEIQAYCKGLLKPLCDFMAENGSFLESERYQAKHLIGFQLNQKLNAQEVMENLKKNQIYLSVRGTSLRVSPNVYNTEDDIKKLIEVLKNINR